MVSLAARASSSLVWRPSMLLQMPILNAGGAAQGPGCSRSSSVLGHQAHRLPFRVMWGITWVISTAMAVLNFGSILIIERLVHFKFEAMQTAICEAGVYQ